MQSANLVTNVLCKCLWERVLADLSTKSESLLHLSHKVYSMFQESIWCLQILTEWKQSHETSRIVWWEIHLFHTYFTPKQGALLKTLQGGYIFLFLISWIVFHCDIHFSCHIKIISQHRKQSEEMYCIVCCVSLFVFDLFQFRHLESSTVRLLRPGCGQCGSQDLFLSLPPLLVIIIYVIIASRAIQLLSLICIYDYFVG